MEQPKSGRPLSTISTAESVTSVPSTPSTNRLLPSLSRLSNSTSRPSVLLPAVDSEPVGYTAKTARIVSRGTKELYRRSGLSGLFPDPSSSSTGTGLRNRSTLDTSSILYPTLRSHSSPAPYPILVFSLSEINTISPIITNDELFDVLLRRLEPWVGEEAEGGYVLVVLAADDRGGKTERSWPGVGWWVWKWKRIPRKYRKNLKRLYIVHPSLFTRTLLPLFLPLISPKSYLKLHTLTSVISLATSYRLPLSGMTITLPVLHEESRMMRDRPDLFPQKRASKYRYPVKDVETGSTWSGTISSTLSYASSYLPFSRSLSEASYESDVAEGSRGYWARSIQDLVSEAGGRVPPLFETLGKVIVDKCTDTEGIFRRTSNSLLLDPIVAFLDLPISDQPTLPWIDIAVEDALLPPKLLLRLFADLHEPLIPSSMYPKIRRTTSLSSLNDTLIPSLSSAQRVILEWVISLMRQLSTHEAQTKMAPLALAIVLAPSLINGPDPLADAEMCLQPGKSLPLALRGVKGGEEEGEKGTLVGLLEMWIREDRDEMDE